MTETRGRQIGRPLFAIGCALRLAVAIVNRQANDDHVSVVRYIAVTHRFPARNQFSEAYHPKLYHLAAAVAWDATGLRSTTSLIVVAQLVSCAAGIGALYLVGRALIGWSQFTPTARVAVFALVALNPKLITLSGQATNDTFVMFFSTAALLAAAKALHEPSPRWFALTAACVGAALFSKTSAVVTLAAIAVAFGVAAVQRAGPWASTRPRSAMVGGAVVIGIVVFFAFVGPFRSNRNATGDWFAINVAPDPAPSLLAPTFLHRPGTVSVVDSLASFDLGDMLVHPFDTNGASPYPLHRTSLWSQVYGRTWFAHFDQWPPSWADQSTAVRWTGRVILVVALLPTALLLEGLVLGIGRSLRIRDADAEGVLLIGAAVLFLVYLAGATLRYRDFDAMKAEYLYPTLVGYGYALTLAADPFVAWCRERRGLGLVTVATIGALLVAGVADVLLLVGRLA